MITTYKFNFGILEICEDYIKAVMNEGVTVIPEHNIILLDLVEKHFKNKPFIYITHRINSYAVNPTVYLETAKIPNLIAFAVVSDHKIQRKLIAVEKNFFSKSFQFFEDMETALKWKNSLLFAND